MLTHLITNHKTTRTNTLTLYSAGSLRCIGARSKAEPMNLECADVGQGIYLYSYFKVTGYRT